MDTITPRPPSRTGPRNRTCVDAPLDASSFFGRCRHVVRCGRVSGLMVRLINAAGPYGDLRTGAISLTRARGASSVVLVYPIPSRDRLPVHVLRPAHTADDNPATTSTTRRRSLDLDRRPRWPSAPRPFAPCGWPGRRRPACGAFSPSCAPARIRGARRDAPPSGPQRPRQ